MLDNSVSDFRRETVKWIASENIFLWNDFQDWLRLVIQHSETADFVFGCKTRRIVQPLLDFFTASVNVDVGRSRNHSRQWQVMLSPKPAQREEGKANPPSCGKNHMSLWPSIKDTM
jgi:hypothetical protein